MARRVWADRHRVADRWDRAGMLARHLLRRGWSVLPGLRGLVLSEPALEEGDRGEEVIVEGEQQVDVVEVLLAREAVGEVVARVDGGAHLAAAWADEAEVALAHFARGNRVLLQPHWQKESDLVDF